MSVSSTLRSALSRVLDLFDDRISTRADAAARARGHSITRIPGTRTKVYRNDALWDLVPELGNLDDSEDLDEGTAFAEPTLSTPAGEAR
jgi:hypothetical protein